jgi:hypothetical protein
MWKYTTQLIATDRETGESSILASGKVVPRFQIYDDGRVFCITDFTALYWGTARLMAPAKLLVGSPVNAQVEWSSCFADWGEAFRQQSPGVGRSVLFRCCWDRQQERRQGCDRRN